MVRKFPPIGTNKHFFFPSKQNIENKNHTTKKHAKASENKININK